MLLKKGIKKGGEKKEKEKISKIPGVGGDGTKSSDGNASLTLKREKKGSREVRETRGADEDEKIKWATILH